MFTVEQANLVAARTMGSNRYMATVLQQNRGCGDGDDTDMRDATGNQEGGERENFLQENPAVPLAPAISNLGQAHEMLRERAERLSKPRSVFPN
jgi:hypothetical protein